MINKKLIIKAVIYRILAFVFMFFLCLILTKKIYISVIAAVIEFIAKTVMYYLYEIGWKKLNRMIQITPINPEDN